MAEAARPAGRSHGAARWRCRAAAHVTAAATLALAVAGCATVPTSGAVQPAIGGNGQPQQYAQLIAVGPRPKWGPEKIVLGFLHASATFTNDHAVAREYLTASLRREWHPGWEATVVAGQPQLATSLPIKNLVLPPGNQVDHVTLTGQRLASLSDSGQYKTSTGAGIYRFKLISKNGEWRIASLPSRRLLLLYESDFVKVYQPHNLYFFSQSGTWLVPDPVFVPQQESDIDLATGLVKGLIARPQGWLAGAAQTRFPAGTTLVGGQVKINGSSAIVNLGGAAAKASAAVLRLMAAQLVSTLASSAYTPSAIQSVQMQINGAVAADTAGPPGAAAHYSHWVPLQPTGRLYFLTSGGVSTLSGDSSRVVTALTQPLHSIAVSPLGGQVAGIAAGKRASRVYSGPLRHVGRLVRRQYSGGSCTSLSWDNRGDVFAAAGNYIWMFPPGADAGVPVVNQFLGSQTITGLQVAPDGVRIAMIVRNGTGTSQVEIGAIRRVNSGLLIGQTVAVGAGITDPSQLAWYGPYNILVLAHPGRHARLYEVPVNGGAYNRIYGVPGAVSITSDGAALALGTAQRTIWTSAGLNGVWQRVATGQSPAYPG
jgi:Lipoprotein LpqB beta-propeller domain